MFLWCTLANNNNKEKKKEAEGLEAESLVEMLLAAGGSQRENESFL